MKKSIMIILSFLIVFSMSSIAFASPFVGTDDLADMNSIWNKSSGNIAPDTAKGGPNESHFDDMDGLMRGAVDAANPDWVAYETASGATVTVLGLFWPNEAPKSDADHFAFFSSADGENWSPLSATNNTVIKLVDDAGDPNNFDNQKWLEVTYTLSPIPDGHKYVKLQWPNMGSVLTQSWGQRLHKVTIEAAKAEPAAGSDNAGETVASDDTAAVNTDVPVANPKTGDAGVMQYIALALLAAGAIVIFSRMNIGKAK